jgi:predicted transcriptional regulator
LRVVEYPVRVSVQLSDDAYEALLALAEAQDRSLAWIIREACEAYLAAKAKR